MFKFVTKVLAFLGSAKARKALELAEKVVKAAKDAQDKLPK